MRIILLLLCACAAAYNGHTQDLSNKGKEFWIGYGDHVGMHGGAPQKMSLYITSDVNTTGQVEIAGIGSFIPFTITANRVTVVPIPLAAQLNAEGLFNRGIRVIADRPVVVYAHIFANSVSGATLCLPTNTLGREYVSINYRQASNEPTRSFSYVFVVATEDNTTVEIVPSVNTQGGWAANSINTVVLNRGQVYQVLAHAEQDLTGTTIRSVSGTGAGCKRIAVYSGSGKISIGCGRNDNEEMSSDNLFQQVYPTAAWGKKYIAVSSKNEQSRDQRNFYRIVKSKPSAVVKLNGSNVPQAAFTNSLYYDFDGNGTHVIESTEPVQVAQYFTTQRCAGNVGAGDPEMIFLNPIEQTISNVTLYSSPDHLITYHGLNIVVRNTGSALTSMKLDGASIGHLFEPLFQDADYSFARIEVSAGTHNLVSDSGFNVIAYGFGNAESYGYSAGTNLKDLYQFITIQNDYSTVNFPAGCKNTPFRFAMTFPY
ncbi:MAG TPA: IgGFc-binding protein, partial [Chitinophagaceae bacterium]|nr:IgGFc-binding protein [Chitinophagaceae bacterium]